jgi:proline dehydrogenase
VRSNVSIKLTQIGLAVDEDQCAENLRRILERAKKMGAFLRIDMEDSPWVDRTLGMYRRMRSEYGLDNVGVVIQSYLYRSEEDVRQLCTECTGVRLCKGAYKEPASVAFPKKEDVDASYDRIVRLMLDGALQRGCPEASANGLVPPPAVFATHDEKRIAYAKAYAQQIGLPKRAMEFQMLNGIRRDLQEGLAAEGYPVRIYVPFGTQWYPYFMRRLAERPANVWFFVSNFFRQ